MRVAEDTSMACRSFDVLDGPVEMEVKIAAQEDGLCVAEPAFQRSGPHRGSKAQGFRQKRRE